MLSMSRLDFYHKPVKAARRMLTVNGFGGEPLPNSPHLKAFGAAILKALAIAPVAVKSPQNEIPPSLEVPCDRAGSNRSQGAKFPPPQVSTPPRLLKTGAIATAFQIVRPMIRKALERFLSVISRPVQEALKPPRLPSASRFEIVS